ncbi:MAG: hypothetical protein Q8Q09_25220 [Deltaproteobacteria bacterium]|nr:hypothetical protein [Deltaproteobacteria bacterium]
MNSLRGAAWVCAMSVVGLAGPAHAQLRIQSSTALGGESDDDIRGLRLMRDGSIVIAGIFARWTPPSVTPVTLGGASTSSAAMLLRIAADGRSILAAARVGDSVTDLALDRNDRVIVALGAQGVLVVDPTLTRVERTHAIGFVQRVDVGSDDRLVALVPSAPNAAENTPGAGRVFVFDPAGMQQTVFDGYRNTLDVALDSASQTVVLIGWRQANAFDGMRTQPVQIAYLRGVALDGTVRWTNYDWSTDMASPSFINTGTNNMADTRGYRVSVGHDQTLVAAFECAGGNHIFRWSPRAITERVAIVGGDRYHDFANTRSEHKTFFARFNPMSGAYVSGQQLVGRLASGAGNAVRVVEGAMETDERGRIYLAGAAAAGLPLTVNPEGTGDYTGGGYLIAMTQDFRTRLLVTRVDPGGISHAVDARVIDGQVRVAFAGQTGPMSANFFSQAPLQARAAGRDGFVVLLSESAVERTDASAGATDASDDTSAVSDAARTDSEITDGSATAEMSTAMPAGGCACTVASPRAPRGRVCASAWISVAALTTLTTRRRRRQRSKVTRTGA